MTVIGSCKIDVKGGLRFANPPYKLNILSVRTRNAIFE
jgi:hypothetical protein